MKEAIDFMDNLISAGSLIVYATMSGRSSAKLTIAEVLEVKEGKNGPKIKVQPLQDSQGHRWSTWVKGQGFEGKLPVPVTLHRLTNVMVIT